MNGGGGSSAGSATSGDPSPLQASPPDTMGDVYAAWRKFYFNFCSKIEKVYRFE